MRVLNLVAALRVMRAVIQPGEHERTDVKTQHDERRRVTARKAGGGPTNTINSAFLDDAEGLQAHRQEKPA